MNLLERGVLSNGWFPVGSPVDIRRHNIRKTMLLGREVDLVVHPTWISPSADGRQLPVTERLGLVWTTLGQPNGPPQPLIEYYEVDRTTLNVSSGPVDGSPQSVLEDTLRRLEGSGSGAAPRRDLSSVVENHHEGGLLLRSEGADLGVLGAAVACEAHVTSPCSVVITFRHASRARGQESRKDFYAVFCQPVSDRQTAVHRLLGIVDLRRDKLDLVRQGYPFAPTKEADHAAGFERNSGQGAHDFGGVRQSVPVDAFRAWVDERYGIGAAGEVSGSVRRGVLSV